MSLRLEEKWKWGKRGAVCLLGAVFPAPRAADVNNKKHIKQHFLSFRNKNETIPHTERYMYYIVHTDWPLEKYATLAAGDALTLGQRQKQTNYLEWATVHFPHFPCTLKSIGVAGKTGELRTPLLFLPLANFCHKYSLFPFLNPSSIRWEFKCTG